MVLPLFVFLKHSASQTGYQGGGHESHLPANEGYVFTLCALLYALRKWRRIGWKNVCKLWLEERTSGQLKGEGGVRFLKVK